MERAKILLSIMKEKNINTAELARMADIPYTTVMTILKKGVTTGSFINVKKICEALSITVDELENRFKNTFDNNKNQISNLTNEQKLLIEEFTKLNTIGQNEAIKRIEELSYIEKYKKTVSEEQATTKENDNLLDISIFPDEIKESILHTMQVMEYSKTQPKNENIDKKTLLAG